jgi:hypothetical protein
MKIHEVMSSDGPRFRRKGSVKIDIKYDMALVT